ncbi:MAG: GGDEF domain-containing protein [Myxococcota bacterium]
MTPRADADSPRIGPDLGVAKVTVGLGALFCLAFLPVNVWRGWEGGVAIDLAGLALMGLAWGVLRWTRSSRGLAPIVAATQALLLWFGERDGYPEVHAWVIAALPALFFFGRERVGLACAGVVLVLAAFALRHGTLPAQGPGYAASVFGAYVLVVALVALYERSRSRCERELTLLTTTDALTGAFNRRHLEDALAREVSRAVRHGSELAVLAVDIDHFKQINDRFGHLAGDRVLVLVAKLLVDLTRRSDHVCRTGGDEFCIVLPETDAAGAAVLAERIFRHARQADGVSVSVGVAAREPSDTPTTLLARADRALYAAKAAGRGRVRVA